MPKERASIATRLRRRDNNSSSIQLEPRKASSKREDSVSLTSIQSLDDNLSFSPRTDPDIYIDELHNNFSFIRGTDEENAQHLKEEQDRIEKNFGKKPHIKLSTFYNALVGAPVPSKRTRHRNITAKPSTTNTFHKEKRQEPMNRSASKSRLSNTTTETEGGEQESSVPLPLNSTLPANKKMNPKDKEKEYWRRQRRVFVHSRFVTNEEGVKLAKSVYSNMSISANSRMVISFQGNIGNFRTKLRRVFDTFTKDFGITNDLLQKDTSFQEKRIYQRLDTENIKKIWGHWIADPFVDSRVFYADKKAVDKLKVITAKLMVIHYMEQFNLISAVISRRKMKEVDMISRTLVLPDTSEYA